jgi:hypothetical protein
MPVMSIVIGGFLHVPYLPNQAARHATSLGSAPSMALEDIVRGIEIVLTVAAARPDDDAAATGALWGRSADAAPALSVLSPC